MSEDDVVKYPEVRITRKFGKAHFIFPNASQGKPYKAILVRIADGGIPILQNPRYAQYEFSIEGLEGSGLTYCVDSEKIGILIEGIPTISGTLNLCLKFTPKKVVSEKDLKESILRLKLASEEESSFVDIPGSMIVNPDPKLLWKNLPTPKDIPFYKEDEDLSYISTRNSKNKILIKEKYSVTTSLSDEKEINSIQVEDFVESDICKDSTKITSAKALGQNLSDENSISEPNNSNISNEIQGCTSKDLSLKMNSSKNTLNQPFDKDMFNMVAASKRGRSHAHEARARDDDFELDYIEESGWYVSIVADGAGSAQYSRRGSQLACQTVKKIIREKLTNNEVLEKILLDYVDVSKKDTHAQIKNEVLRELYNVLPYATIKAKECLKLECASVKDATLRDFSTTLMIAICKKVGQFWVVAGFGVGDGGICVYKGKNSIRPLSVADSGEYAGQTRFITMGEIYSSYESLIGRIKLYACKNIDAICLMTDGVSDPKFETDANFESPTAWDDFMNDLKSEVDFTLDDPDKVSKQLLDWLDFWSPGNHDDRTIAILY